MCLVALSSFVIAQSAVDGTWTGEVQGGRGPQTLTITLKADAGKLTGSAGGGRGRPGRHRRKARSPASDLKFKTEADGAAAAKSCSPGRGTLKGDEIAFSRTPEGGQAQTFTAKRQK